MGMGENRSFIPMRILLVLISLAVSFQLSSQSALAVESLLFHDWQADVLSAENSKKQCYIQFTGISKERILVSMRLAMMEEKIPFKDAVTWTLIKVSAGRLQSDDPSDVIGIKIEEAWLETSAGSSIGLIKKLDQGQAPQFLGGVEGFRLFEMLLKGIGKDGITVGFRTKSEPRVTVLHAPAPPKSLFVKLYTC